MKKSDHNGGLPSQVPFFKFLGPRRAPAWLVKALKIRPLELEPDLCWTQIYVGHRSLVDTDLCWTQIYVGHRSVLDTDLRWSTGPSWATFLTIFGHFPSGPRSVPGTFFINGKALQIGSRGVFEWFWRFFRRCSGRSPDQFPALPDVF